MLVIRNISSALISTFKISDKEFIFIWLLKRQNFGKEMLTVLENIIINKSNVVSVTDIFRRKKYIRKVWSILITSPHKTIIICASITLTIRCNKSSCWCLYKLCSQHIRTTTLLRKCCSYRSIHTVKFDKPFILPMSEECSVFIKIITQILRTNNLNIKGISQEII